MLRKLSLLNLETLWKYNLSCSTVHFTEWWITWVKIIILFTIREYFLNTHKMTLWYSNTSVPCAMLKEAVLRIISYISQFFMMRTLRILPFSLFEMLSMFCSPLPSPHVIEPESFFILFNSYSATTVQYLLY